jgi:glycosyltransferase involved in cell wall biosynthesis
LARVRAVELRVIGAAAPKWQGVTTMTVGWSLPSEAAAIGACDVGIMPLPDGPWERGKCGYKLIQYMACGLPVIGSPVGVNSTIIDDGIDGFVAANSAQWEKALSRLAGDPALRLSMGRRGREKVVAHYSVQAVTPRLAALLTEAAC